MLIDQITPLILTYNEAANIGRNLERLGWAREVVVVDSFSEDDTTTIAGRFGNVRVLQRKFDSHAGQWNYALNEAGIQSEWILALDADYILPAGFRDEIETLNPPDDVSGYRASFRYCISGRPIRGSLYPPVTVLFRRKSAKYVQDGHTQRVTVPGKEAIMQSIIDHDDRKPMMQWLKAQHRYCALEAEKLKQTPAEELPWPDRIRKHVYFAPVLVPMYCLFVKGNILDGSAGIRYACQRGISELLLSLFLIDSIQETQQAQS